MLGWDDAKIARQVALVLGTGGIGSCAAQALARLGVAEIILLDYDTVDVTNLNRQVLFKPKDVGRRKVDAAADSLRELHCSRTVVTPVHADALREWHTVVVPLIRRATVIVQGIDQGAAFDAAVASLACELRIPVVAASSYWHTAKAEALPFHRRSTESGAAPEGGAAAALTGADGEHVAAPGAPEAEPIISPQGLPLPSIDFCWACDGQIGSFAPSLARFLTPHALAGGAPAAPAAAAAGEEGSARAAAGGAAAAGEAAPAASRPGFAATRGASFLPADDKGPMSTGVLGSTTLNCIIAAHLAVNAWVQDLCGTGPVSHSVQLDLSTLGEDWGGLPPCHYRRKADCWACGPTPLSLTKGGLRALAFHPEPVVLATAPGETLLFQTPAAEAASPAAAGGGDEGAAGSGAAAAPAAPTDAPAPADADAEAAPAPAALSPPPRYVGVPAGAPVPAFVDPLRMRPVAGTEDIYTPCVPAPDFDAAAYLRAPASTSERYRLPTALQAPLVKSMAGTVHGLRSGTRSAIVWARGSSFGAGEGAALRLKGCGHIVTSDPAHSDAVHPAPGFPVREIAFEGGATAEMILGVRMTEVRGCAFAHTALREQVMSGRIASLLGGHGLLCGNTPRGATRYGFTPESGDATAATVPKWCGVFETVGDKRLGGNVLPGLQSVVAVLARGGAAGDGLSAGALAAASTVWAAFAAAGRVAKGALVDTLSACCPSAHPKATDQEPVDVSAALLAAATGAAPAAPADLPAWAAGADAAAAWPADAAGALAKAAPALGVDGHWLPLWRATTSALAATLASMEPGERASALPHVFHRLGREAGVFVGLLQSSGICWGSFSDNCPPLEPHCNAHSNNLVVVADSIALGGVEGAFPEASPAPEAGALASQLLAPVDFDMAFEAAEFRSCVLDDPRTGTWDADLWRNVSYFGGEVRAMERCLAGDAANTGVAMNGSVRGTQGLGEAAGAALSVLSTAFTDTLVRGYREGVHAGRNPSGGALVRPVITSARLERAAQLLLRLALMVTDGANT